MAKNLKDLELSEFHVEHPADVVCAKCNHHFNLKVVENANVPVSQSDVQGIIKTAQRMVSQNIAKGGQNQKTFNFTTEGGQTVTISYRLLADEKKQFEDQIVTGAADELTAGTTVSYRVVKANDYVRDGNSRPFVPLRPDQQPSAAEILTAQQAAAARRTTERKSFVKNKLEHLQAEVQIVVEDQSKTSGSSDEEVNRLRTQADQLRQQLNQMRNKEGAIGQQMTTLDRELEYYKKLLEEKKNQSKGPSGEDLDRLKKATDGELANIDAEYQRLKI